MGAIQTIHRRTTRLLLRPLTESDDDEFARVLLVSREAWAPWIPAGPPALTPAAAFAKELERSSAGAAAGTHARFVGITEDGRIAGLFGLNEIVRGVFQSAYASWQVSADQMGRGLGTEGVAGLLDIAFGEPSSGLGLHRVQANIMPTNGPSLRIAEKLGLRREGLAARCLKIAGRWEDHVMFAITREERGGIT